MEIDRKENQLCWFDWRGWGELKTQNRKLIHSGRGRAI